MNDALAHRLLQIAADHHQQPMLTTKRRRIQPDTFLGAQEEEDYMEGGCDSMGDKTDVMNSKYDRDYGEVGIIELEEVIVVAPRKLNRWQVVKLEIRVNTRDMVNDIRNDARQLGRWLKARLSGPMSLRGNRMSRGIGGMGIQFTSSQGKSGLTDTPVAAPGVEVITHNVDAWWDPFMTLWGPSFPVTNSTPMVPDAEGFNIIHLHKTEVKNMGMSQIKEEVSNMSITLEEHFPYVGRDRGYYYEKITKRIYDTTVKKTEADKIKRQNDSINNSKLREAIRKYNERNKK
ncbi:hypothetical protein [Sinomicrobium sp. M5D2P17]